MNTQASVSVVIPYSPDHTPVNMLHEAKKSVQEQDIDTEIIVVEDTEQRGPAWARNQGLNEASSRYVAFLDADDLWLEHKLTRQLQKMQAQNVGLCVECREHHEYQAMDFIRLLLTGQVKSLTSSILIDRTQTTAKFEESLYRHEDHLFMIESAAEAGVCCVEDIVKIQKHDGGLSSEGTVERNFESKLDMWNLATERTSLVKNMENEFKRRTHYRRGVQHRRRGEYKLALRYLLRSFQYGVDKYNIRSLSSLPFFWIVDKLMIK